MNTHPCSATESLTKPLTPPRTLALALAVLGALPSLQAADHLVPYTGRVLGAVLTDVSLLHPDASARIVSAQTGRGEQRYQDFSMSVWNDDQHAFLETWGIGITTAGNGDQLRIRFSLHGVFTGPTTVSYTGEFEVLSGGTGRFEYPKPQPDLGHGLIAGDATIDLDPLTGAVTFAFAHRFDGTLLSVGAARR